MKGLTVGDGVSWCSAAGVAGARWERERDDGNWKDAALKEGRGRDRQEGGRARVRWVMWSWAKRLWGSRPA